MLKRTPVRGRPRVRVEFVLPEARLSGTVSVVGEFNDWDPAALPLQPRGDGTRAASVVLDVGHAYAFRYQGSDGRWYDEETSDGVVPDRVSGWRCLVRP
jgi:1,4-alpha-glucan branching enzyme